MTRERSEAEEIADFALKPDAPINVYENYVWLLMVGGLGFSNPFDQIELCAWMKDA